MMNMFRKGYCKYNVIVNAYMGQRLQYDKRTGDDMFKISKINK